MAIVAFTLHPVGKIVEVLSDFNVALVRATATITERSGGGSSTATESTYDREYIFPAKVLTRGSKGVKDYFNYEVGDNVCLIDGQEDNTFSEEMQMYAAESEQYGNFYRRMCFIAGAFYTLENRPPAYYDKVRMIDFGNNNFIEVNLEQNTLEINFKGAIYINGKEIYLNG